MSIISALVPHVTQRSKHLQCVSWLDPQIETINPSGRKTVKPVKNVWRSWNKTDVFIFSKSKNEAKIAFCKNFHCHINVCKNQKNLSKILIFRMEIYVFQTYIYALDVCPLSCPGWPVRPTCPVWPVSDVQSELSCAICPSAVLPWLSWPSCPVPAVLSQLDCSATLTTAILAP